MTSKRVVSDHFEEAYIAWVMADDGLRAKRRDEMIREVQCPKCKSFDPCSRNLVEDNYCRQRMDAVRSVAHWYGYREHRI